MVDGFGDSEGEVGFCEFFSSNIHELVEVEGIGLFRSFIEFLDHLVVGIENGKSVPFLIRGGVLLVVFLLPVNIEINDLGVDGS